MTCVAESGRIAVLILAAGRSSRMAPLNKLLIRDEAGQTMIGHVVEAALGSQAAKIVVVTGHQADEVEHAVQQSPGASGRVRFVRAPDFDVGLSASLKAGIAAVGEAAAALICLGDMPLVTAAMMDALITAFDPARQKTIIVPTCRGERGNPILWGRDMFAHFATLAGDTGARGLLARHKSHIAEVELGSNAILQDFDTPQSLDPKHALFQR